jgi:xylulokinase
VYLGIDIGTSAAKSLVLDEDGRVRSQASAALRVRRPQPHWAEQDPESWWEATVAAVRALPRDDRIALRAVGLAGQMHGATLLDRSDQPLRPAILWNDGRSQLECAELERREPRTRAITGNQPMPGFTAPKLLWVRKHEPQLFERIATVLLPKDFVRLRLSGERYSDVSDASGTLWLNGEQRQWSEQMLAATELERRQMPMLVEGTAIAGRVSAGAAAALGIPEVPIAGGGGDNAAAAVGLGVTGPAQAFLSLGTSGVLFVVTDRFRPSPERGVHAFCHCLPARWHQMSVLLSAASAIDWVARASGFDDVRIAVAAAQGRGIRAGTPIFLPYLSGERTPHNDPHARGVFFGLSQDTEPADLVCAALVGVSLAFADGLAVLLETGAEIGEIALCGGGARLDYWAELLASALNRPLTRPSGAEVGAALGAARLAMSACASRIEPADPALFAAPPPDRIFEPDAALAAELQRRRPVFSELYRTLKPLFPELP